MATTLTVNTTNRTTGTLISSGGVLASADATGNNWVNNGRIMLIVANAGGGSITVTFDIQTTADVATVTDPTGTVAAGATRIFGPFPVAHYNDSNGKMNITWSGVSSVTVAVFEPTTS